MSLGLELHSLRHEGASFDVIGQFREVASVNKRLPLVPDASVKRNEQAGRVAVELAKMPAATRECGAHVEMLLNRIFLQPSTTLGPPPPVKVLQCLRSEALSRAASPLDPIAL